MANYHIHTFGCQMNFHDSENIESMLIHAGHSKSPSINSADIIIFNTCTIREKAYQKATSAIGRFKSSKKKRVIAICGCVAQQSKKKLLTQFPHINIVCGPDQIHKLPDLITKSFNDKKFVETEFINDDKYPFMSDSVTSETNSAYITIIKGCNCKCSYCIVPSVRGNEVSRDPESIVAEINSKLKSGAKEITLLGQNVNRYRYKQTICHPEHSANASECELREGSGLNKNEILRYTQNDRYDFTSLIKTILNKTNVKRLRFFSPHPAGFDDKLISLFSDDRLCPYVHLPLQSGSNNVLKKMKRGYTREKFLEIIEKLRKVKPSIAIGTDIIVGFCDESESDYNDTINLVKDVGFDFIYAFAYSPRPNTASFEWKDNVPKKIKNERLNNLLNIHELISKSKNSSLIGKDNDVLVLSTDPLKRGLLKGRTESNKTVIFAGNNSLIGNIVNVKIKDCGANSLIGELL